MSSTSGKSEKKDAEDAAPTITNSIEFEPTRKPIRIQRERLKRKKDVEEIFTIWSLTKAALIGALFALAILSVGIFTLFLLGKILAA